MGASSPSRVAVPLCTVVPSPGSRRLRVAGSFFLQLQGAIEVVEKGLKELQLCQLDRRAARQSWLLGVQSRRIEQLEAQVARLVRAAEARAAAAATGAPAADQ